MLKNTDFGKESGGMRTIKSENLTGTSTTGRKLGLFPMSKLFTCFTICEEHEKYNYIIRISLLSQ